MRQPSLALLANAPSSPALPVGLGAYSQGMESAVAIEVTDRDTAAMDRRVMTAMLTPVDMAALWRLAQARQQGDMDGFGTGIAGCWLHVKPVSCILRMCKIGGGVMAHMQNLERLEG